MGDLVFDALTHRPAVRVKGLGTYVPQEVLTNHQLEEMMNTSDEWIRTRTGISERRRANLEQGTSDLGVEACREALKDAGITVNDIDLMVVSTITPDYYMPGVGVLIQHKLGIPPILSLDLRGQCAGFSWALATADAYARLGKYRHILVVGADLQTRILDFTDQGRDTAVIFGDGAGALVLDVDPAGGSAGLARVDNQVSGLIDHELGSDGAGCHHLIVPRPGMSPGQERFITSDDLEQRAVVPQMEGRVVFRHAVQKMEQVLMTLLKRHQLTPDDVDLLVPHQANLRINEVLREKLGMSPERVVNVIDRYGNTTSATLPLCLGEAKRDGRLQTGKLVATVAFGSGFSWGANLLRW